jgi:hypothetical protein
LFLYNLFSLAQCVLKLNMVNIMSKIWIGKNLVILSWGTALLALCFVWLTVFNNMLKAAIDLPVPLATTVLDTSRLEILADEKSSLINKIASYPDKDPNVRVSYNALSDESFTVRVPSITTKTYELPLFATTFLLSIPELFSSVEKNGLKLHSSSNKFQSGQTKLTDRSKYRQVTDPLNSQFDLQSNYASFFSVTLMQDRLPPAISQDSVSEARTARKTYSPKPKLRPQNLDNRILIAVGYFTVKQNLDRTLQTLELTGYPYSHKRLEEQKGSLVTIGPFKNRSSAKKALEITKFVGFSDAYILN